MRKGESEKENSFLFHRGSTANKGSGKKIKFAKQKKGGKKTRTR